jgi:RNA polymerase sigma-70 factor (ECF subfamily)
MPELSDEKALLQAVQGDKEAFGVLYERYVGRIYNYVYYRTGNPHELRFNCTSVFRAMRRILISGQKITISAWLYRIAHNLVANWHRDRSRRPEIPLDAGFHLSQRIEHPEAALMQDEERDHLLLIIRELSPDRQQLLFLKFVEHFSNAEIGQIMGRTEGAVKSLYHRTLLSLREDMNGISLSEISDDGGID